MKIKITVNVLIDTPDVIKYLWGDLTYKVILVKTQTVTQTHAAVCLHPAFPSLWVEWGEESKECKCHGLR